MAPQVSRENHPACFQGVCGSESAAFAQNAEHILVAGAALLYPGESSIKNLPSPRDHFQLMCFVILLVTILQKTIMKEALCTNM